MNVIINFFRDHGEAMWHYSLEHLMLTVIALGIATAIAIPLGILLTRTKRKWLSNSVMGAAGIVQTIPALALIAFIALIFVLLNSLPNISVPSLGFVPGVVALVLYAVLPILRNTYTGIKQVDPSVIEVARGMGMTQNQILFKVELPLSLPVMMAGLRIATVWTIGIATLCGAIGAGGLGDLIFRALGNLPRTTGLLIAGTLPAAAMALTMDWGLGYLENLLTPKGLQDTNSTS